MPVVIMACKQPSPSWFRLWVTRPGTAYETAAPQVALPHSMVLTSPRACLWGSAVWFPHLWGHGVVPAWKGELSTPGQPSIALLDLKRGPVNQRLIYTWDDFHNRDSCGAQNKGIGQN